MKPLLRRTLTALATLGRGTGTAFLAYLGLAGTLLLAGLCLISVGLPLLPYGLRLQRGLANLERRRLRRLGYEVPEPYAPLPHGWGPSMRTAFTDPATRRDLAWLAAHGIGGLALGLIVFSLVSNSIRDITMPLWWYLIPPDAGLTTMWDAPVDSWDIAAVTALTGPVWLLLVFALAPAIARGQTYAGRRLLGPVDGMDLTARVAQLTRTRAAVLDAHTAELRRIERALHDGAQNRLVGVAVLTGAARRALTRDPATADAILERAQTGAEEALAELRAVVRSILPPVLEQRGLHGALSALAAGCAVPCTFEADIPGRLPTSVEATAYFAVAEALTNVSKHSRATTASVEVTRTGDRLTVTVRDDGKGGADGDGGSGLNGLKGRVEAHDGTLLVDSPRGGPTMVRVELPCGS
ncbi:histidine kinase [Actinorhabdospora filicis]|uniref:histidine kinase n=1 Tax=Actinorhabdospora filicis TaxID=1785913 RepID=A0A9W6SHH9_9ACTN|nr:sensor histidine kinase [Actinorhabdospora filicis]GLZ75549.1 histidine kinase [Actinorhabdospora filicis]